MTGRGFNQIDLTNTSTRQAFSLTFTLLVLLFATFTHADSLPSAAATAETKLRLGEVTDYLRTQSRSNLALLPSEARHILGWFSHDWHPFNGSGNSGGEEQEPSTPSSDSENSSVDLSTHFHHKGFLPLHDAMLMGGDLKHEILNNKMAITTRPFFGQSWDSLRHYWGGEAALTIAQRPDDLPWGKIALGYAGGDHALTDHGTGFDLHGDVDLTAGFKLTSGIRQDSLTGDSNYVMLKWKTTFK